MNEICWKEIINFANEKELNIKIQDKEDSINVQVWTEKTTSGKKYIHSFGCYKDYKDYENMIKKEALDIIHKMSIIKNMTWEDILRYAEEKGINVSIHRKKDAIEVIVWKEKIDEKGDLKRLTTMSFSWYIEHEELAKEETFDTINKFACFFHQIY